MGKIRIRTLGEESLEKKQKSKAHKKAEQKKLIKAPGMKGGERIVAVGPTEEELQKLAATEIQKETEAQKQKLSVSDKFSSSVVARKVSKTGVRSTRYKTLAKLVDRTKTYALKEALGLLPKIHLASFDETVELHVNTVETGVSGNITLPYGTGKQIRVAIADPTTASGQVALDALLENIEKGTIDFDILLATPSAMPKLAKVAKILGPRGLMPNPKNATLVKDPQKAAENFKKGQVNFRTEAKTPIIHLTVGKMSFGAKKLSENIQALIDAIKKEKIRNVTLKSTMSPGIRLQLD